MRKAAIMLVIIFAAGLSAGCAKKAPSDAKVLARIGNYELTAQDFNDEVRFTALDEYPPEDAEKAREELLDHIITKKILIQEAQKENFDKDRAFMKEIERYWEQALIKLLVNKKTKELSRSVVVTDNEVRAEYDRLSEESAGKPGTFKEEAGEIKDYLYNRKMKDLFDQWLRKLRSEADVTVYKERL